MTSPVDTPAELAGAMYQTTLREKAAELKQELVRQNLDDLDSWHKALRHEWQLAHPQLPRAPIPPEEMVAYSDTIRDEYYEWVVPAFERYLDPDPDATNPIMGYWEGDLQRNFVDNFLTPLQNASINQAAVAKVVREQLEYNKVIYIRRRKSILRLAEQATEAVRTLKHGRDPKSYMWGTIAVETLGAALGAAPGPGWIASGAVLSIAALLGNGLAPEPQPTHELSAPTAQEVAVNISTAMSKMDSVVGDQERNVQIALDNLFDAISGERKKDGGALAVPEPALYWARPSEIVDGSLRPRG